MQDTYFYTFTYIHKIYRSTAFRVPICRVCVCMCVRACACVHVCVSNLIKLSITHHTSNQN